MKILIIEDDHVIVEVVSIALQIRWPKAELVTTDLGQQGVELVRTEAPNVVILDLGLPDIDGFEVLKQIRIFSMVPIIIMTVRGDETDIVKGLEWGADEYIVKPVRQLELIARINALLRRQQIQPYETHLGYGPLYFQYATNKVLIGKREIKLTTTESHILYHLMINAEKVVSTQTLAASIWGVDYPDAADSIRVYIRRLREKIEDNPNQPLLIHTESKLGYILKKSD